MVSHELWNRRLVVVAGKGGVGRTTVALALSRAFVRRGKRTLLVQVNVPDRVGALFGRPHIGPDICELQPGLFAVNIEPHAARREYALQILRFEFIYRRVFENALVRAFLDAFPGLDDLNVLGKIWFHEQERLKGDRPRFDTVVVDAPATGHAIFLLHLPQVMIDAIRVGPLVEKAKAMREMLTDPERSALVVVALPEEMPVNEAIDLWNANTTKLHMPPGYVIANAITEHPIAAHDTEALRRLRHIAPRTPGLGALIGSHDLKAARARMERGHIDRLIQALQMPPITVKRRYGGELTVHDIETISVEIEKQVRERPLA